MRAVLSSGSNMGDARAHLQTVADEFAGETLAASSIYATAPWGNTDQPDFLNQSLLVDVDDTPHELLARCQKLEQRAHRVGGPVVLGSEQPPGAAAQVDGPQSAGGGGDEDLSALARKLLEELQRHPEAARAALQNPAVQQVVQAALSGGGGGGSVGAARGA